MKFALITYNVDNVERENVTTISPINSLPSAPSLHYSFTIMMIVSAMDIRNIPPSIILTDFKHERLQPSSIQISIIGIFFSHTYPTVIIQGVFRTNYHREIGSLISNTIATDSSSHRLFLLLLQRTSSKHTVPV